MSSVAGRFPARRLAMGLVRRGFALWALTRAMLLAVGMAFGTSASMSPAAALMLLVAVGGLGALESRRLNEHRFFANLGVSTFTASLLVVLPALIAEIIIGAVLWR